MPKIELCIWRYNWCKSVIGNAKQFYFICRDKYAMSRNSPFPYLYHGIWKGLNFNLKLVTKGHFCGDLLSAAYYFLVLLLSEYTHTYTHRRCMCYGAKRLPCSQRTYCVVCGIDIQEIISRSFRKHLHCWRELSVHWFVARKMTLYLEFHTYQITEEMRSQKLDTVQENGKWSFPVVSCLELPYGHPFSHYPVNVTLVLLNPLLQPYCLSSPCFAFICINTSWFESTKSLYNASHIYFCCVTPRSWVWKEIWKSSNLRFRCWVTWKELLEVV